MRVHTAAALASPLFVVGLLCLGLFLVAAARYPVVEGMCVVLAACLLALLASAKWLASAHAAYARCERLFVVGAATVLAGWIWQRLVFVHYFPVDLPYGYFLKPEGAVSRFHLVEAPSATVGLMLGLGAVATCVVAWRHGARGSLVAAPLWWGVLELIFYVPTQNLMWDGDASLFI